MRFATVLMPAGAGSRDLPPPPLKRLSLAALRKFLAPRPSAPAKSPVLIFPPTGPSAWRMSVAPQGGSLPRGCLKSRKTTSSSIPRPPRAPSGCAFLAEGSLRLGELRAKTDGHRRSGRLFLVASRAVSLRHFSIAAWFPPRRISGTFQPLYSAGRV